MKITACQWCDRDGKLTTDHKVPIALGGRGENSNIQILCTGCHDLKSRYEAAIMRQILVGHITREHGILCIDAWRADNSKTAGWHKVKAPRGPIFLRTWNLKRFQWVWRYGFQIRMSLGVFKKR